MIISVEELIKDQKSWNFREVQVLGYFKNEIENISIRQNKSDLYDVIWVDLDRVNTKIIGFELPAIYDPPCGYGEYFLVVITGIFKIGKSGHFGLFDSSIINVKSIVTVDQFSEEQEKN